VISLKLINFFNIVLCAWCRCGSNCKLLFRPFVQQSMTSSYMTQKALKTDFQPIVWLNSSILASSCFVVSVSNSEVSVIAAKRRRNAEADDWHHRLLVAQAFVVLSQVVCTVYRNRRIISSNHSSGVRIASILAAHESTRRPGHSLAQCDIRP